MVSTHAGLNMSENLNTMEVISAPEAFLVYMGCRDKKEYIESLAHCQLDQDHARVLGVLRSQKYASFAGKLVFRHVRTLRTATVDFQAQATVVEERLLLISKVVNIHWQDDDEVVRVLGETIARRALADVESRTVERNGMRMVAIPALARRISDGAKAQLKFLKCEFGVNVVYSLEVGTNVRRSVLFPEALLHSSLGDLSMFQQWVMVDFRPPQPLAILQSAALLRLLQTPLVSEFYAWLCSFTTAAELHRVKMRLVPLISALTDGDHYEGAMELITAHGRQTFQLRWYRTRSIVAGVVMTELL